MEVPEKYLRIIQCRHDGAKTIVRTPHGYTVSFEIGVALHQDSALRLFIIVQDVLSDTCRTGLPIKSMYADALSPLRNP